RPAAGRDRPRPPPFRRAGRSGEPSSFPPLAGRARARGGDRLPHQRGERGGRRDPRRRGARFPAGHAEARGRWRGRGVARPRGKGGPALARHPCRPAPHAAHPALSQGGEGRRETLRDGLRPVRGGGLHGAPLRGHLAMALFSRLVAGSFPLGAMMANAVSPVAFTALRFLLSGVIIGVAVLLTTGLPRQAVRAPWRYAVLGGLFAAYFVLMFEGLKTAAPVSAAAVFTLTPIVTAGFGFLLLRQPTTPRIALALAIGAAGALWVIFRGDWQAMLRFHVGRGEAIYFAGCVAHALYTPMVRKLNRGEHPLVFTFGMTVAGTAVTTLWGWGAIRATDWTALPGIVWVTLLYTSVFASAATC